MQEEPEPQGQGSSKEAAAAAAALELPAEPSAAQASESAKTSPPQGCSCTLIALEGTEAAEVATAAGGAPTREASRPRGEAMDRPPEEEEERAEAEAELVAAAAASAMSLPQVELGRVGG
jgi:hypothetical protein